MSTFNRELLFVCDFTNFFFLFFSDSVLAGFSIPATTHILPNLYALNMCPDLWENPEQFMPERFLRDGLVHKPDYFIPFSVGKLFFIATAHSIDY